ERGVTLKPGARRRFVIVQDGTGAGDQARGEFKFRVTPVGSKAAYTVHAVTVAGAKSSASASGVTPMRLSLAPPPAAAVAAAAAATASAASAAEITGESSPA